MDKEEKNKDENARKLLNMTNRSWITYDNGKYIKIGDDVTKLLTDECEHYEIKEFLRGVPCNTWIVVFTTDGSMILIKD